MENGTPRIQRYQLEDIAHDHSVVQDSFVPCTIVRLGAKEDESRATLLVRLEEIDERGPVEESLILAWFSHSRPTAPLALTARRITEDAACGVSFAVVTRMARLEVTGVTADGDRFDYWVRDGDHEFGLEVSGTVRGHLHSRHREKVRQLRDNPYGCDGYVVVVRFASREVIFSFHVFGENTGDQATP